MQNLHTYNIFVQNYSKLKVTWMSFKSSTVSVSFDYRILLSNKNKQNIKVHEDIDLFQMYCARWNKHDLIAH